MTAVPLGFIMTVKRGPGSKGLKLLQRLLRYRCRWITNQIIAGFGVDIASRCSQCWVHNSINFGPNPTAQNNFLSKSS